MSEPFIIQVDGIIGAGKSYLIENILLPKLGEYYNCREIREPVNDWGKLLDLFYNDKKRWAYHFQTTVFCSRMREIKKIWDAYHNVTDVFISERGPESDKLFMNLLHKEGDVNDVEYQDYHTWCDTWNLITPYKPDIYIYVVTDIETAVKQIKYRDREGEKNIDSTYLSALALEHDIDFGYRENVYYLTNDDINNTKKLEEFISVIRERIKNRSAK